MPNWTEGSANAVDRKDKRDIPLRQRWPIQSGAWQNEAVISPRVRKQIRLIAGLWLAWTIVGLFYITQDSVPRLYRGQAVAWKYVFVGWMVGVYVCAVLTPAVLWLGNRWPVERRIANVGYHLGFSVVFSILASTLEVPVLLLLGVFPAAVQPPLVAGIKLFLSFGIQGAPSGIGL
jgi:hypothetical protein